MSSLWTLFTGFSGEHDSTKRRLRKIVLLPAALCVGLCLTACGDSARTQAGPSPPSATGSAATAGDTATPTLAPIIAPPGSDDRPLQPGSLGRSITADGLPALQPPKGINVSVDTLFADDIKDPIERSKRVETAVIEMRRDLDAAMPAIKRLVAIEKDIQLLSSQLETLLNGEQTAPAEDFSEAPIALTPSAVETTTTTTTTTTPPPASAPPPDINIANAGPPPEPPPPENISPPEVAAPSPQPPAIAQPAAAPTGAPAVLGLRLGEHPGRTRLVFDITGPVSFRTDLDNGEKILIVEIEKAAWTGTVQKNLSSPLVQSYTVQPIDNGGVRIIMTLKAEASVASEKLLAADDNAANARLVIDLAHP